LKFKISISVINQGFRKILSYRATGVFAILIGLVAIFTILSPRGVFIKEASLHTILKLGSELAIVTMSMGVLLIAAEFDLSVGSELAFCAFIAATAFTSFALSPYLCVLISIAFGALLGVINGIIVTKLHISSLITTLGMMYVYGGLVSVLSGGYSTSFNPKTVSPIFVEIFVGSIGPIPIQVFWLLGVGLFLYFMVDRTKFGNWIYATGSNKESAEMMGINTDKVKIACFALVGAMVGLVAIMQTTRILGAFPVQGTDLNLEAIAGAVVGGISIYGGIGSVWGALLGAMVIRVLGSGLITIGVPAFYFRVSLGLAIILSVAFNIYLKKVRTRAEVQSSK
jgi:simple sugar transport system permease protein